MSHKKSKSGETLAVSTVVRETLKQSIHSATFIAYDLETTGGNPSRNSLTEICALKVAEDKIESEFYSMVNPEMRIPSLVRRMTGITQAMVKDAPVVGQVMPDFVSFIGSHVLISHNASSDIKFVRYYGEQVSGREIDNFHICTHLLAEKIWPDAKDKSLRGLGLKFGFAESDAHRARDDSLMTLKLWQLIRKELKRWGVETVKEAIYLQNDLESCIRIGPQFDHSELSRLPPLPGLIRFEDSNGKLLLGTPSHDGRSDGRKMTKFDLLERSWQRPILMASTLRFVAYDNYFEAVCSIMGPNSQKKEHSHIVCPGHKKNDWLYLKRSAKGYVFGVGHIRAGVVAAFGPLRDRKSSRERLSHILSTVKSNTQNEETEGLGGVFTPNEINMVLDELGVTELRLKTKHFIGHFSLRYLLFYFRQFLKRCFYFLRPPRFDLVAEEVADLSQLPPNILGEIYLVASRDSRNSWNYCVLKGSHLSSNLILDSGPTELKTNARLQPWLKKECLKIERTLRPLKKDEVALIDSILWAKTSKIGQRNTVFIKIEKPRYLL